MKLKILTLGILFLLSYGHRSWSGNIVQMLGCGDQQITVIYLKGDPYELGYIHGNSLRTQVVALYDSVLNAASRYGYTFLLDLAYQQMEPFIPQAYKDEMQGLADGAGLDITTVHRLHAIPDLSEMDCTFFAAWGDATANGNLYQIRALDYATDLHLQEHPAILVYEPTLGRRFVNVGWVGFIGCVSGMNYDGICVSEIGDDFDKAHQTLSGEPMPFLLRDVLQNCQYLEQAVEKIQGANRTSSYLYCVGDAKIPDARTFQTGANICNVFTDDSTPNSVLNDIVYFSMGIGSSWNSRVYGFLQSRYGTIDAQAGMELMRQLGTGDLHSISYDPANKKLWVANAGIDETDAFNRTFIEFDLTRADSVFANYQVTEVSTHARLDYDEYVLKQNYPNPFNSETRIEIVLPQADQKSGLNTGSKNVVDLAVFDLEGHRIRSLLKGLRPVGFQVVTWDGRDDLGRPVATGLYFYKLTAGSIQKARRMLYIR